MLACANLVTDWTKEQPVLLADFWAVTLTWIIVPLLHQSKIINFIRFSVALCLCECATEITDSQTFIRKTIIMRKSVSTHRKVMGKVFVSIICFIESSFTVGLCIWQEKEYSSKVFLTNDLAFHMKGVYRHTHLLHSLIQVSLGRCLQMTQKNTFMQTHHCYTCTGVML